MSMTRNDDRAAREQALDLQHSFIVQAPAGSGKTELLSQRFLALLARVESPEQILAITFTRKAAAEMRRRVLEHLLQATAGATAEAPHQRLSLDLARDVLEQDRRMQWQLLDCPFRLRIMTIDAFNASLVRQMPMNSGLAANTRIADKPGAIYESAAEALLGYLGSPGAAGDEVERVLLHLDNSPERFVGMIASMLARRDHWIRHAVTSAYRTDLRKQLEDNLAATVTGELQRHAQRVPDELGREWCDLARIAAAQMEEAGIVHNLGVLGQREDFPLATAANLPHWQALVGFVMTQSGSVRKSVNKRNGFSTADRPAKDRMLELLATLREDEHIGAALNAIAELPAPRFADDQWQVLEALLGLLPRAAAELDLLFEERGEIDYTGLAFAAGRALGDEDAPEDLALLLDYRLNHILVDEFQDTSVGQVELLNRLTAGWQPDDGRTFFCVGDPMQSIYRFRDADVGLFLAARRGALALPRMLDLQLSSNFRSTAAMIQWFNRVFPSVLAARDNPLDGAVSYAPATSGDTANEGAEAVEIHPIADKSDAEEAQCVVDIVARERVGEDKRTCAILVRGRPHLAAIMNALRAAGVPVQAVEIEALRKQPHICDLLALTRAMLHRGDRTAWLSLLRAPFVGLRHADLLAVCGDEGDCIADLLLAGERLEGIAEDGRERIARLSSCLRDSDAERGRRSLRRWVEGMWLALGGAATLRSASAVDDVEAFFEFLDGLETAGDIEDIEILDTGLDDLYASPDPGAGSCVQIMTIHKAKGLEFDTVILPGLHRKPRADDRPLLRWMEIGGEGSEPRLLFAPITAHGEPTDALNGFLAGIEKRRASNESARLLYVAATRAREKLHLVFGLNRNPESGEFEKPVAGSLLSYLWSPLAAEIESASTAWNEPVLAAESPARSPIWWRLKNGWRPAPPLESVAARPSPAATEQKLQAVEFDWAGETIRMVGTVTHRLLQRIATDGAGAWNRQRLLAETDNIVQALRNENVPAEHLQNACDRVVAALTGALASERGRWLLDGGHADADCELSVSGLINGRLSNVIIDRTFRDRDGQRWIVDYKTSAHEGAGREQFLDREVVRYREQLQRYATLMSGIYPGETLKLGLYFPLLDGWRSWEYDPAE